MVVRADCEEFMNFLNMELLLPSVWLLQAPNSYRVNGNGLYFTCDGLVGIVNGKPVEPLTISI